MPILHIHSGDPDGATKVEWNGIEHCGCLRSRFPSPACPPAAGNYGLSVLWPANGTGDIASESENGRKKIYADISTARCTHTTLLAVALLLLNW